MKQVLVFGTFDNLHPGHEFLLTEANKRGDLNVVIARDSTVETIKGFKPHQSEVERQAAIQNMFPQVNVVLGDAEDYLVPVRNINPNLILLGYDQKLPPGISESDLPGKVERVEAFEPEKYKSSLLRNSQ